VIPSSNKVLKASAGGRILLWSDPAGRPFRSCRFDSPYDVYFALERRNIVWGDEAKPSVSTLPGGFAVCHL
jgi:hypothetical protein